MTILERLRAYWEEQGIANSRLATAGELSAFEARHDVKLPPIIANYFLTVNGTKDGECGMEDSDLNSFWHLDQVKTAKDHYQDDSIPNANRLFVFADHSIECFSWAVRLSSDPSADTPILISYALHQPIARTFDAFLEGYVCREGWALFPDPSGRPVPARPGRIIY
jgi:hypothetical protein